MANWSMQEAEAALRRAGVPDPIAAACGEKPTAKRHKFNARQKTVGDITFASSAEARAYQQLQAMEAAGEIANLKLQPKFLLQEGFRDREGKWHRPIAYVSDFMFTRRKAGADEWIVIEVKGFETDIWRLKQKLFKAKYPDIRMEIWKGGKR